MKVHPPAWRVALGFLLAPVVPCLVVAISLSLVSGEWSGLLFGAVAMIAVSEALSLAVGLPIYLIIRRTRTIGVQACVVGGIAVAVLFKAANFLLPRDSGYSAGDSGGDTIVNGHMTAHGYISSAYALGFQSLLGATIALCFWGIAISGTKSSVSKS